MNRRRLTLFTRCPTPGGVKTRLIPALGPEGAVALHRRLVVRTLRTASAAAEQIQAELEIHFDGGSEECMRHWLGDSWVLRRQSDGDLGQRMAKAFEQSFRHGSTATVITGSDSPGLTAEMLIDAFERLTSNAVVFGPANDGGYYLLGLSRMVPELFEGIPWGSATVLADSLAALEGRGVRPILLAPLDDVDRPEDLSAWRRLIGAEDSDASRVSVIIPTLNEAEHISKTLKSAQQGNPHEIIVVDGGSTDETRRLARDAGVALVVSAPGRSRQMNAGAARATGNRFLFLHADTMLPPNWKQTIAEALHDPQVVAGAFRFRIAGNFLGKRLVEWGANLRSRWSQQPYGDQGLFLRSCLFEELGGFANLPIMEDYELVNHLRRRGRVVTVPEAAITSGRRWQQLGLVRTTLTNRLVLLGYLCGLSPQTLARLYRH